MTGSSIAGFARFLTNTDSTTLTDADALTLLNIVYGQRILNILKVSVDKNASINEAYDSLVSVSGLVAGDVGFNGEYPFPTNLLKPIRAEIKLDNEFLKAEVYDINENQLSEWDESVIQASFEQGKPYVRFERNSYFVRPLPETDVAGGIHIWYEKRQDSFTDLTGTPDFEQNLHDILAYDIAELESIRHTELFNGEWRSAFLRKKNTVEATFLDFYKSRFKRNLKLKSKSINYK